MVSARQVKAARALLAWSQEALAKASGLSEPIVARLEAHDGEVGERAEGGSQLLAALEKAGVAFLSDNGEGVGVRLHEAAGLYADLYPSRGVERRKR